MNAIRAAETILLRVLPVLVVAAAWEALSRARLIDPQFLPSLSEVLRAWAGIAVSGELIHHTIFSLINLCVGLFLGLIFGTALGVLMAWYPVLNATIGAIVQMTFPIPRSALIPVMILWFGLGAGFKIAAIFTGCLLPVVVSAYNGTRGVDQTLIWSALALGATRRQALWEVAFRAAIPDILAGTRSALAIGFVLMVTSEFLIGQRGLGYLIAFYGDAGLYPPMFAAVFTVAALGFIADRLYLQFMQRLLQWRD
jgi:NitT/TauT family transport system permease protein